MEVEENLQQRSMYVTYPTPPHLTPPHPTISYEDFKKPTKRWFGFQPVGLNMIHRDKNKDGDMNGIYLPVS